MNNLVQIIASFLVNSLWGVTIAAITPVVPPLRSILAHSGFIAAVQNHSFLISSAATGGQLPVSDGFVLSPALILILSFPRCAGLVCNPLGSVTACTIVLRREARPVLLRPEDDELTKRPHFNSSLKYGVTIGSILFLFSMAAGIGAMARPINRNLGRALQIRPHPKSASTQTYPALIMKRAWGVTEHAKRSRGTRLTTIAPPTMIES